MAVEQAKQLSCRAVVGNLMKGQYAKGEHSRTERSSTYRIRGRAETVEVVVAALIGIESTTQVHVRLLGVLLLVQAIGCRMPHVDLGIGNWLPGSKVCHRSVHAGHVATLVFVDDRVSEGTFRGAVSPERSQNL